jgi:hypothetical protein
VCSAVRKMMHLEANVMEIVPESVINNILHEQPINNILHEQPQKSYLPTQQQVEELVKYKNRKLVIPWSYILEPEKEYAKNLKMPGIMIFSFLSSVGVVLPQLAILGLQKFYNASIWILLNTYMSSFILNIDLFYSFNLDDKNILPKELHEKIDIILREINRFFLNWMNFLFCYFLIGPHFHTNYLTLFFTFIFVFPLFYIHRKLSLKYIHAIAIQETAYEFY